MFNTKTFKSWEFLFLVLATAGAWLTSLASSEVGNNSAVYITAGAAAVYALARGLAKVNHDSKDWWQTSEFWASLIGAGVAAAAALEDTISTHTFGLIMATLGAAMALANGLRKVPVVQAAPTDSPTSYDQDYGANALDPDGLDGPDAVA